MGAGPARVKVVTRRAGGWPPGWSARPPGPTLVAAAAAAALAAVPLGYVAARALGGGAEVWTRLWATRIPGLLASTLSLTAAVTALAVSLGVSLAWLVARTDLPGRHLWAWLLALPLVFPPYLGAFTYITVFGPRGLAETWLEAAGLSGLRLPSIYGFGGVALVVAVFTYPYVYLLVLGALRRFNQSLEDAARASGFGTAAVFWRVTVPLLRPAVAAGALLVALYVLADFGAVSMLRYPTFTRAIYLQLVGRYDRSAAAALSLVLVVIALLLLWLEARGRGRARFYQTVGTWRPAPPLLLGRWRGAATGFCGLVAALGVALPAAVILYWTVRGLAGGVGFGAFADAARHSLQASALAATAAVVLAFPVAFLRSRHPGPLASAISGLAQSGYALPGLVAALGVVVLVNRALPVLYGTAVPLYLAYVIRFLPYAMGAEAAALDQVSPHLEEAAQSLGHRRPSAVARVTVPLILPGLASGWALVFLSALKELPATLLLRPAGFDTLPVRIWLQASEGFYPQAGPAALILVGLSVVPVGLILARSARPAPAGPPGYPPDPPSVGTPGPPGG